MSNIKHNIYFYACWLFIGFVASLDVYLTIRFSDNLPQYELNPIARMILKLEDWTIHEDGDKMGISRFVAVKVFMTILVLGIIRWILYLNKRYAMTIITCVALCQALLLFFLLYNW
jgi:hypothetical protein